jgi:hypothetical protein
MLRRQLLTERNGLREAARDHDAAVDLQRDGGRAGCGQLPDDLRLDITGQARRRRKEHGAGVGIVLGLRDEIGGNPSRDPVRRHNGDLARPGKEVDRTVRGHQRLRRRHIGIARAHDLVDARDRRRAVRERCHGMCTADPEQPGDPGLHGREHHGWIRPRAGDVDLAHPGGDRGDRGHQERRGQRISASGHVAAHAVERGDTLRDAQAGGRADRPRTRNLFPGDGADVGGSQADRPFHRQRNPPRRLAHLGSTDLDRFVEAVELLCERKQHPVAAAPDAGHDVRHRPLDLRVP